MQTAEVRQWHKEAQNLLNRGDLAGAHALCIQVVKASPDHADGYFLLGIIAAAGGQLLKAIELIERAIALEGRLAEYHAHLGRCQAALKRFPEAILSADNAMAMAPTDALTLDTIGCVYSRVGAHEKAVPVFRAATARRPDNAGFQNNLGASLKFLGDFDAAEQAYESAISADPVFYKAHSALSQLRRQTPSSNHIERLEGLLESADSDVNSELHLRHALAKECEDTGEYRKAFDHLTAGNARKRREVEYSIDEDRALFAALQHVFDALVMPDIPMGDSTDEPVFIVGMPRSGTTLVERIVSSHSKVFSAGELQNFGIAVKKASGTVSSKVLDVETITNVTTANFAALGKTYLESTRPATGQLPHFTDKMPLNFFYLGFIHLALPNAKILCLHRNPMDTCLSNFRQLFSLNVSYYNYAFDILDTGRFYVMFRRLMDYWQKLLPGKILSIQYEQLVADQEHESRQILEFCGLEWEDACLAFENNAAPVATASSVQVREPMYQSAVDRWKRYEAQLAPLRELLQRENIPV